MVLIKLVMPQFSLVGNYNASEMQIIVVEKVIDDISIKCHFRRRNLSGLYFKRRRQAMLRFYLTKSLCNLCRLLGRTPNGANNHSLLAIVLEMAAFIAIDVVGFTHRVAPFS